MPAQRLCLRNRELRAEALPESCLCNAPAERTGFFFFAAVVWVRARVFVIAFFTTSRAPSSAVASAQKFGKQGSDTAQEQASLPALDTRPRGTVVSVATTASSSTKVMVRKLCGCVCPEPTDPTFAQGSHARLRAGL